MLPLVFGFVFGPGVFFAYGALLDFDLIDLKAKIGMWPSNMPCVAVTKKLLNVYWDFP